MFVTQTFSNENIWCLLEPQKYEHLLQNSPELHLFYMIENWLQTVRISDSDTNRIVYLITSTIYHEGKHQILTCEMLKQKSLATLTPMNRQYCQALFTDSVNNPTRRSRESSFCHRADFICRQKLPSHCSPSCCLFLSPNSRFSESCKERCAVNETLPHLHTAVIVVIRWFFCIFYLDSGNNVAGADVSQGVEGQTEAEVCPVAEGGFHQKNSAHDQ